MSEYLTIVIFICVSSVVSLALGLLPMFLAVRKPGGEKLSTSVCGFNPLSSERKNFDIKFYLVSKLFIIFDVEIAFIFSWAVSLSKIR
jgi:NADH-quinone oxidoreductase subunit A